jgi:menaquinol-cytochrome c reductase iron-sulfur subunit
MLGTAIGALWCAIAAALGIPASRYLLSRPRTTDRNEWIDAGEIARLVPDQPVEMAFVRRHTEAWRTVEKKATAWVVKHGNQVLALSPACTHLGCAYGWDASRRQFVCPCHASLFAIDGRVLAGPAPRPLDRYQTRMEGDRLLVKL